MNLLRSQADEAKQELKIEDTKTLISLLKTCRHKTEFRNVRPGKPGSIGSILLNAVHAPATAIIAVFRINAEWPISRAKVCVALRSSK